MNEPEGREVIFPLKKKIKCPICNFNFIPEGFDIELANFTHKQYGNPERKNFFKNLKIRPLTEIHNYWITNCPNCKYIFRFIKSAEMKEIVDEPTGEGGRIEFSEYNKIYKYNHYEYEKPYMDYNDYFIEKFNYIQEDIKKVLNEIKIAEWGNIYKDWDNNTIDSFKFLVRFISSLDLYYKSQFDNDVKKEMPDKIKELNFPEDLTESLIKINNIRNKAVHGGYELDEQDENTIDETFFQLMFNLVLKQLEKLNLNDIQIEKEYNFIDVNKIKLEIRGFLHMYLGGNLRQKDSYNKFFKPLLENLGISIE